jgi:hypothetical protein
MLSSVVNMTLLVLSVTTPPPPRNKYDYIHVSISSVRTFLFLLLAVISEIQRNRPISIPDTEATPQQPLKANGSTQYGTFDSGPTHPHAGRGGYGSNPPPQGGWVTYIKSFKVFMNWKYEVDVTGVLSASVARSRQISSRDYRILFPYDHRGII